MDGSSDVDGLIGDEEGGEGEGKKEMGMVQKVMIDHRIPILDMQILQVQIGIIGRLEELFEIGEDEDGDDGEGTEKSNGNVEKGGEKGFETKKELRDVILEWRTIFDGGYDNEEGEEKEMEGRKRNVRKKLNDAVETWLGSWEVEDMSVPGGGSVVIEVVLG